MSDLKLNKFLSNPNKELFDNIYPILEKNFPSNSNLHQLDIRKFIDKNNEILFAAGPTLRLYFYDEERDRIFNYIGLRKLQINDIIKKDKTVESSWMFMTPFNLSMVLIIRYYMMNNMKKQMENSILFLALSFYSSLHYRQFRYPPNENIMNYTLNHLSNKFKLKQFGTLIESIKSTALTSHENYIEYLKIGTDVLLNTYLLGLHTRLSGFIKNIAEEYYKNQQEGNYINLEGDDYSEENYHIADNDSFIINRLSDNVTSKIVTKGIDYKLVKLSANICNISVNGLQKSLQEIVYKKDKEFKVLVSAIIQLYLLDKKNTSESISSKRFIDYCLQIYVKSNTNDENIIKIKEILDNWLTECSPTYLKTNRAATKSNLRKSVYMYLVFCIQQESIKY